MDGLEDFISGKSAKKPSNDGAARMEISGVGQVTEPDTLDSFISGKNYPPKLADLQKEAKERARKQQSKPSESFKEPDFQINPSDQKKRDEVKLRLWTEEAFPDLQKRILNPINQEDKVRATKDLEQLNKEIVKAGGKPLNVNAPVANVPEPAKPVQQNVAPQAKPVVAAKKPATPDALTQFGRSAAGLADTVIGNIQALPGTAVAEVGYPLVRAGEALGLVEPGRAERGRAAVYKQFVEPYTQPIGRMAGVTETPEYRGEASQQAMQFVAQNMDKGADWISKKTGMSKADVENMLMQLTAAAPAAVKGAKPVITEQFAAKKAIPVSRRIEPTMEGVEAAPRTAANEPQATLRGVGAARVNSEQERIARAKELPIPIELSKDQATRNPADVRFARETAKDPVLGQALQEKYANDNIKIQQNLDHLVEQTGAEFVGLPEPELAQKLIDTVEPYRKQRKQQVTDAYNLADQAGETNQMVSYKPLVDYIESQTKNRPTKKAQNPILGIVEEELKANDPSGAGQISLRAMDDIYKTIINETDPTQKGSLYHSGKLRKAFDKATEGAGGDLYRQARKLNAEYMTEFEDTPVIKNLTSLKKGTTQRTVALENLVDKSILKGTADDVRRLFTTLEKTPEGQAMANELRGYVAQHIKNEATKGVQLDINGNRYVSTKDLDTTIKNLDKSGKLEYLFGKKNAEYYRTLNEATKDIQTIPQNTTNTSGTASTILSALGEMGLQGATTGVPVPVLTVGKHIYGKVQTKKKLNKINEFINYSKEQK